MFYGLVQLISATGCSPNPTLQANETSKMNLCQILANAVSVCLVFLQLQFTEFSRKSFTDIHCIPWVVQDVFHRKTETLILGLNLWPSSDPGLDPACPAQSSLMW